jgi:hypothetical protein
MKTSTPLDGQAVADVRQAPQGQPGPSLVLQPAQISVAVSHDCRVEATTLFATRDGTHMPAGDQVAA